MDTTDNNLVDCYNCTGSRLMLCIGLPYLGCPVCQAVGNSNGKMFKKYYRQSLEITYTNYSGKIVTETFHPPNFIQL